MSWAAILLTVTSLYSCSSAQQLTQPPSVSVSPGGTARLSCTLSSGYSSSSYWVSFYQKKPDAAPIFLYRYYNSGNQGRGSGIPERFSVSPDTSRNLWELVISGAQSEDEADYHCMIWSSNNAIFGPGTPLNVITGKVEAPTLSIFPPSVEQLATDTVTYVCLMSDFTPKSFTVTWLVNGKAKSEGVETSQVSKQSNNLYLGSSYLSIRSADYNKNDEVACKVTHEGKDIVQTLTRSECV